MDTGIVGFGLVDMGILACVLGDRGSWTIDRNGSPTPVGKFGPLIGADGQGRKGSPRLS